MSTKIVVFDFDGTVVDSMPVLQEIAVDLLQNYFGMGAEIAKIRYVSTTGLPFVHQMETLFPKNELNQKVVEIFEQKKLGSIFQQQLFPETKDVILSLKKSGFIVAISSSTIKSIIVEYFRRKDLLEPIDEITGFRPGFEKGKDHFNFLSRKFNVQPNEMVYVGDSLKDLQRSLASQVPFIGRIGMFSKEEFEEVLSDCKTIKNLKEIINLL